MPDAPEASRQRSTLVLGGIGLALLAAVLCRSYSSWVASRYAPAGATIVDLNAADSIALERLPGIGTVLAQRIARERDERGPFRDFADLKERVEGVGAGLELALEGLATFGR